MKQYEKEQQQLLKEIQRQKEANLKKEQNKKKLDEGIVAEHMKMMQTITRPRIGVIVMRSEMRLRTVLAHLSTRIYGWRLARGSLATLF